MFYFLPYADDERDLPITPWVNYGLIGFCSAAFLIQLIFPEVLKNAGALFPGRLFGYLSAPSELAWVPTWSSLFTHVFLHTGFLHLAGNMLYLFIFGDDVERRLGHIAYLFVFLGFGAVSGLAHAIVYPLHGPVIGASGAISGVLGAYLVYRPLAQVHFLAGFLVWYRTVRFPAWAVILVWVALNALWLSVQTLGDEDNVAYLAHLSGFVVGVPVGVVLRFRRAAQIGIDSPRSQR